MPLRLLMPVCRSLLQIQKIVRGIPPQRQTLFFSATWPREVKAIASQFVQNRTVHVFVGGVEEKLMANKAITQVCPPPVYSRRAPFRITL